MHAEVTFLDLRLRRRLLLGYTLGMAFYALVVVVLYPQFKDAVSLDQFSGSTAAALFGVTGSLTSPEGWLNGNIYQNFLPLVMLLIDDRVRRVVHRRPGRGRHALPRDHAADYPAERPPAEGHGAGRCRWPASRSLTMLCVVGRALLRAVRSASSHLAGISLGVALLGLDFGLLALAIGVWSGSRGLALGVAASLAAVSYLVNSLAPVDPMDPARQVRLAVLLVHRQRAARERAERGLRLRASVRRSGSARRGHRRVRSPRSSLKSICAAAGSRTPLHVRPQVVPLAPSPLVAEAA